MTFVRIVSIAAVPINSQKHDIFVRIAIMIAILIKTKRQDIYEDCDHDRSLNKEECKNIRRPNKDSKMR